MPQQRHYTHTHTRTHNHHYRNVIKANERSLFNFKLQTQQLANNLIQRQNSSYTKRPKRSWPKNAIRVESSKYIKINVSTATNALSLRQQTPTTTTAHKKKLSIITDSNSGPSRSRPHRRCWPGQRELVKIRAGWPTSWLSCPASVRLSACPSGLQRFH